ncbi:MAG TPA: hypothetical protein PKD12_11360 [Nitrospira sp.]|nr:hypothetical protein [Nitrospira sp.]
MPAQYVFWECLAYNFLMKTPSLLKRLLCGLLLLGISGCVTVVSSQVEPDQIDGNLVVGRVITTLHGERARRYLPQLRSIELENQNTSQRYQIEIDSGDEYFTIDLLPGRYRLTRVQISEGAFRSMADISGTFSVDSGVVTYVGTWRFMVDSPRYGRMVVLAMNTDTQDTAAMKDFLVKRYPSVSEQRFLSHIPDPFRTEARLYEVMPYPRYPRYFRRHWW